MNLRNAVVTGATGHLGNVLVRRLLELGVPTTALCRRTTTGSRSRACR